MGALAVGERPRLGTAGIRNTVLSHVALAATLGVCAGIATAQLAWWPVFLAVALLAAGAAAAVERARSVLCVLAVAAAAAQVGAWRAQMAEAATARATDLVQRFTGEQEIRGLVDDEPVPKGRTTSLTLSDVLVLTPAGGWSPLEARVLVSVPPWPAQEYGDYLQLAGKLQPLQGGGAIETLNRRGILASMSYPKVSYLANPQANAAMQVILRARQAAADAIHRGLPDPVAGTLAATLLGLRGEIPKDQQAELVATGTVHLIVISGFKLSLLAFFLLELMGRASRRFLAGDRARLLTFCVVVGAIALYTAMTGATPSSVRAALMVGLVAIAKLSGRAASPLAALAIAGLAILVHDPSQLADPGFQLSCLSVAGIVALSTPAQALVERRLQRRFDPASPAIPTGRSRALAKSACSALASAALVSLGATASVMPVLAASFHTVSLVSPLANLVGMPLLGPVMLLGALGTAVAMVTPPLAPAALLPAWGATQLLDLAISGSAAVPGAAFPIGELTAPTVASYYVALAGLALLLRRLSIGEARKGGRLTTVPKWRIPLGALLAAGAASLVAEVAAVAVFTRPPETLQVTTLDVAGQATLIQTPAGKKVLVDGGKNGPELTRQLGQILAPWDRAIDLILITDPKTDHIGALDGLNARYDIGGIIAPTVDKPSATFRRVVAEAPAVQAQNIDLGQGALLANSSGRWQLTKDGEVLFP
ncbi:MAG: ComEC/Rec2 family competence protein [Chloroflexi bacterium]|nr:ComEC/Rec2 family competence protein [Chloroflexota bacterium]